MRRQFLKIIIALTAFILVTGVASAEVTLRFAPADSSVEVGSVTRLSIMCDEVLDLRTIELFVEFDSDIVGSVSGGSGTLFTESGFNLFQGFELSEPNVWHGYCVVMGAYDYIAGPGELFYWEFVGLSNGTSPIVSVSVGLAAPDATILPDVILPPTSIVVGHSLAPVQDIPQSELGLRCYPNPFNPRTEIQFELHQDGMANLSVFNLQGQRVALLHQGHTARGILSVPWDGRDNEGRIQPGGLYLFRLETRLGVSVTKGVLLK